MRKPIAPVLVLAALLTLAGCGSPLSRAVTLPEEPPVPVSAAETAASVIAVASPSDIPAAAPAEPERTPGIISEYRIFAENVSWTEARARCEEEGGHLVVINDSDEFRKVTELAADRGLSAVWIGLHRELGMLVWETTDINAAFYYSWDVGEPSEYDGDTPEDYVFLWNLTGRGWLYNDTVNDPAGGYPETYGNRIGFVCEIEKPAE